MSLLFECAVRAFSPADAEHVRTTPDESGRDDDPLRLGYLARLASNRRLNVVLTRAERLCGLVGDWDTLRDGGDGRNACADLYRDLYDRLAGADRMGLDEYA